MNGAQVVIEALTFLSVGYIGIVAVIVMGLGFYYLGKAIWLIVGRRS